MVVIAFRFHTSAGIIEITLNEKMGSSDKHRDFLFISENPVWLRAEFRDGTNVSPTAETALSAKYSANDVRLDQHEESPGWQSRAERLLVELRQLRTSALPIGGILIEQRTPRYGKNDLPARLNDVSPPRRYHHSFRQSTKQRRA